MLTLTPLPSRDCPAALASAGGVVYLLDAAGGVTGQFRPFEQSASHVPVHLAADADRIWVGAGVGGGPRLQVRDRATLAVTADVMIGDPNSRTGVTVAAVPAFDPVESAARAWERSLPVDLIVTPIDGVGGVAGRGGPTAFGPDGLPARGAVWVDPADAAHPATLRAVVMHELGHVLGIGTAPRWFALSRDGFFHGPAAVAVYGGPVPLDPDGVHWGAGVDSLLGSTLAVGVVGPGPVTLAAVRDLGW